MNKFIFFDLRKIWKGWFLFGCMDDIREKMPSSQLMNENNSVSRSKANRSKGRGRSANKVF